MQYAFRRNGSVFQPSLPARGATVSPAIAIIVAAISTLAPREGSDYQILN